MKYEGLSAVDTATSLDETTGETSGVAHWRPPDGRRMLQLALAAVWLLDGVLQLQPFFFTSGPNGLSAMLKGATSCAAKFTALTGISSYATRFARARQVSSYI